MGQAEKLWAAFVTLILYNKKLTFHLLSDVTQKKYFHDIFHFYKQCESRIE